MNYELTEVPVEDKSSKFQLHNKCDSVVKCQIHILNELNFQILVSHKVSNGRYLTELEQTIMYRTMPKWENSRISVHVHKH